MDNRNTSPHQFDYIVAGAGCAGLSLAMHALHAGGMDGKRWLLIDRNPKTANDRTWCFWETGVGLFEPVVHKRWERLRFYADGVDLSLPLGYYRYKMIRGADFYAHCKAALADHPSVHWLHAPVGGMRQTETGVEVTVDSKVYAAPWVFNSIVQPPQLKKGAVWMLQHFRGWFIRTAAPVFNPDEATLMDFRTGQQEGSTFFYVLPFSDTEALVEYTLFSEKELPEAQYQQALDDYICNTLGIDQWEVFDKESGVIPMTDHKFTPVDGRIVNIGTAGGYTKGSSGYTFSAIQRSSKTIAEKMVATGSPLGTTPLPERFAFYDRVLLRVLQRRLLPGDKIFARMFQRNDVQKALRFLDNQSTLSEELSIISSFPTLPFARASIGL